MRGYCSQQRAAAASLRHGTDDHGCWLPINQVIIITQTSSSFIVMFKFIIPGLILRVKLVPSF